MAFTDRTFFIASFKKLQGSAHTDNTKEPFNEPLASQVLMAASQIIGEEVSPNPVTASGASVIEHIVADLELDGTSNDLSYRAKFPAGYAGVLGIGVAGEFVSEHTFAISPILSQLGVSFGIIGIFETFFTSVTSFFVNSLSVPKTMPSSLFGHEIFNSIISGLYF